MGEMEKVDKKGAVLYWESGEALIERQRYVSGS
jgi:hypothetical protein